MFTKRVLKTVAAYLVTDRFGLGTVLRKDKLEALVELVTHGLNRCGGNAITTLPILHAFSIQPEVDFKIKATQKNLLSQQIKDVEYAKLNGKRVQDVLLSSEVAMIITIIRNYMVRTLSYALFSINDN